MAEWSAEREVDAALAATLIASQFPELRDAPVQPLGVGWDNTVFLVDRHVFRFPRRTIALAGVEREMRTLPRLAPLLSVVIPTPRFFGKPSDAFPWPFFGANLVPGREAPELVLDDTQRIALARPLASFVKELHSTATLAAVGAELPMDPIRRGDMQFRAPKAMEKLEQAAALGVIDDVKPYLRALRPALNLPPAAPTAVVHGDLHVRHLMLGDDGRLSGVIDWGDLQRNDPGIDLHLLWTFFPPAGRRAFLDAYGPVSDDSLLRARVLAIFINLALVLYARDLAMAHVEREALAGLKRSLVDLN